MIIELTLWFISIFLFTVFGAWYTKRYNRPDLLIALYVIFIAVAQVSAVKIAEFDLIVLTVTAPAAVILFPFTFQVTDMVNEKFGRMETHRMILIAFITQVIMVFFYWLTAVIPAAGFWTGQEAYLMVIGLIPRITFASWVSFLITENLDAWIYAFTKKLTKGKHLWVRNVFSDVISLGLDSVIFVSLAFFGVMPIIPLIIGQLVTKWLVGVADTPFIYLYRHILNKDVKVPILDNFFGQSE